MSVNHIDALISLEECKQVISKFHNNNNNNASDDDDDVKIVNYDIRQFSEGEYPGFLGDYFRLIIKYHYGNESDESMEQSFFVKSLPTCDEMKRKLLNDWGIFRKEAMTFELLMPKIMKYSSRKWSPSCYLSRDDVIILENLELTHYRTLPRHIDPNINHIKMALRTLAVFQASSIIYERLELRPYGMSIGNAYEDMLFETSYSAQNPWCMTSIRALKTVALRHTKYGIGSNFENAIEMEFMVRAQRIFEILDYDMPQIPNVLCHRDIWRNNLMYRFDNKTDNCDFNVPLDCQLIDFQLARCCPLALDVIICIMLPTLSLASMQIDECIKFYYDQLSCELMQHDVKIESIMSYNDFVVACEHYKLIPLMQFPMILSLGDLPKEFLINLLKTNEAEYMRMCNEYRDDVVVEFIEKDATYRRTMTQSVERLIEHLFKDLIFDA